MALAVERLDYRNKQIGREIDRFWLDGPLMFSAVEQVAFLARLAERRLAVSDTAQGLTQEILRKERGDDWGLWAKSGWQSFPKEGMGWWVGRVSAGGVNHPFALNMDMQNAEMGPMRERLVWACLKSLDLLR